MGRRGNSTAPIALAIVAALGLFLVLRKSGGSSDEQAYSPDDPDAAGGARGVCPSTPFVYLIPTHLLLYIGRCYWVEQLNCIVRHDNSVYILGVRSLGCCMFCY